MFPTIYTGKKPKTVFESLKESQHKKMFRFSFRIPFICSKRESFATLKYIFVVATESCLSKEVESEKQKFRFFVL